MKHQITLNGNLEILCDEEGDQEMLRELLANTNHMDHGFMADLLEETGWSGNGQLYQVQPEWIGALTDAPILADQLDYTDDGATVPEDAKVWWYPNYMVKSFAETLIRDGRVLFRSAP